MKLRMKTRVGVYRDGSTNRLFYIEYSYLGLFWKKLLYPKITATCMNYGYEYCCDYLRGHTKEELLEKKKWLDTVEPEWLYDDVGILKLQGDYDGDGKDYYVKVEKSSGYNQIIPSFAERGFYLSNKVGSKEDILNHINKYEVKVNYEIEEIK